MDKLAKDMESPDTKAGLDEVMQLADALQINGTPTFVVGQDVVVGAVGYDQLKDKVDLFTSADTRPVEGDRGVRPGDFYLSAPVRRHSH